MRLQGLLYKNKPFLYKNEPSQQVFVYSFVINQIQKLNRL